MSTILLKFLPFKLLPRHYLPAYIKITYTVKVTLYEIFRQFHAPHSTFRCVSGCIGNIYT